MDYINNINSIPETISCNDGSVYFHKEFTILHLGVKVFFSFLQMC